MSKDALATEAFSGSNDSSAEHLESKASRVSTVEEPRVGLRLGRYVLLREVGAGGMGVVFEAYDTELDRRAAIKILRSVSPHAAYDGEVRRKLGERLMREGQALARLDSRHVPAIYDLGLFQGDPFIATEYIQGQSMRQWLAGRRRSWREILDVMQHVAAGLSDAHACGLIHRDLKPENIMITDAGQVYVLDFGLVTSVDVHDPASAGELDGSEAGPEGDAGHNRKFGRGFAHELTRMGGVLGTPSYMSPEQHRGEPARPATDQFSFAVTLYEALYGKLPFRGTTRWQIATEIAETELVIPEASTGIPHGLVAIVQRGLSREPSERYPSMAAMSAALAICRSSPKRRMTYGLTVVVSLALSASVVAYGQTHSRISVGCDGSARIAEVWHEQRRKTTRSAVARALQGAAPETWRKLELDIDAHAESWSDSRDLLCEDQRNRAALESLALDIERVCRESQLAAFDQWLDVMENAEAATIHRAIDALHTLPQAEQCDDLDELDGRARSRLTVVALAELEGARAELARLTMDYESKGWSRGYAERLEQLVDSAESLDYAPLLAEVYHQVAHSTPIVSEDDSRALHALYRALRWATRTGMTERAAMIAMDIASMLADLGRDPSGARQALARARALSLPESTLWSCNRIECADVDCSEQARPSLLVSTLTHWAYTPASRSSPRRAIIAETEPSIGISNSLRRVQLPICATRNAARDLVASGESCRAHRMNCIEGSGRVGIAIANRDLHGRSKHRSLAVDSSIVCGVVEI